VPGTPMSEKDISEKMKVSRTPVREAFIRLSNEALVSVFPQKGSFVSRIDLDRVREERFLRESLETSVLAQLIRNPEPLPLREVKQNLEDQDAALNREDKAGFLELDEEFHALLFDLADQPLCFSVMKSFSSHYRRIRYLSMSVSGVSRSNYDQHVELVRMIEAKDISRAESEMKHHLGKLDDEKEILLRQYPDYFMERELSVDDPFSINR
ncbi:MAG: GntR family transcriptional regulator, partial [Spirochaetales bacterium]|nr:GntR family transcriptional regulator [Spirochaetales bacterium]